MCDKNIKGIIINNKTLTTCSFKKMCLEFQLKRLQYKDNKY